MQDLVFALGLSTGGESHKAAVKKLAAFLTGLLDLRVSVELTPDYADFLNLMSAGGAQIGWLPPAIYARAQAQFGVQLLLACGPLRL